MPSMKFYFFPHTCAQVSMAALEHAGQSYQAEIVNILAGEQYQADYQALNPKGKVPALSVDGKILTENAAIISWLDMEFPEAGLLPRAATNLDKAMILSDLFSVSSGWHPTVRANMMPGSWTTGDEAHVKEKGRQLFAPILAKFNRRLSNQDWYYGDDWSIIDTYFYWCYNTAANSGYDLSDLAALLAHKERVESHSALVTAKQREHEELSARPDLQAKLAAIYAQKKEGG